MEEPENKMVLFEINKHGWILLFQKLGPKTICRAESIKKAHKRVTNENGHRMDQVETEGGTVIQPKYGWDTTKFPDKNYPLS